MESLWIPMQELVPARGRQTLDQFKPKLVESMLEHPQGLVGKEQSGPGECLEEDKSRGVPGRAGARADEEVQAKEGGKRGHEESWQGKGLGGGGLMPLLQEVFLSFPTTSSQMRFTSPPHRDWHFWEP